MQEVDACLFTRVPPIANILEVHISFITSHFDCCRNTRSRRVVLYHGCFRVSDFIFFFSVDVLRCVLSHVFLLFLLLTV